MFQKCQGQESRHQNRQGAIQQTTPPFGEVAGAKTRLRVRRRLGKRAAVPAKLMLLEFQSVGVVKHVVAVVSILVVVAGAFQRCAARGRSKACAGLLAVFS